MFKRSVASLILSGALLVAPGIVAAQTTLPHGSHIEGELLVSPRAGVTSVDLESTYNADRKSVV